MHTASRVTIRDYTASRVVWFLLEMKTGEPITTQ